MATNSSAIQKKIETLKKGLNNKFITASQKEKIKAQVEKLESQFKALAPKKSTKTATSSSLTRLQKLVKNKKYSVYKGTGVDLKKDSDRPAKAIGKRTSKSGKTYYEYRANRIDVKQPPKEYPKLEKGGYFAEGGDIYSGKDIKITIPKMGKFDEQKVVAVYDKENFIFKIYDKDKKRVLTKMGGTNFESNLMNGSYIIDGYMPKTLPSIYRFNEYAKGGYMAKGGKVGMAEWAVTITSEDGESYDWDGFAKSEDDALDKAEKEAGFGSVESSVVMITDENGEKIEYAKGGNVTPKDKLIKELQKLQTQLNSSRLSTYKKDDNSEEEMARQRERKSKLDRFNEILQILNEDDKMAKGGGVLSNYRLTFMNDDGEKKYMTTESYNKVEAMKSGKWWEKNPDYHIAKGNYKVVSVEEIVDEEDDDKDTSSYKIRNERRRGIRGKGVTYNSDYSSYPNVFNPLGKPRYADGGMMADGGELNKGVRKLAASKGFTPKALGKDYEKVMAQAVVEALTDANYHNEARKLVSILEKNPKIAEKPNYPSPSDPKFKEKMVEIEKVYGSEYFEGDGKTKDFGRKVSQEADFDGYAIADAFEFVLKMDGGYQKLANDIKKAVGDSNEMAKGGYFADGGVTEKEVVESNAEMVLSQIKAVKHHAEELSSVVSSKSNIEAWVVGKIERASTDLSDITHYLEGNKDKMSMGGTVRYYAHKMDKK